MCLGAQCQITYFDDAPTRYDCPGEFHSSISNALERYVLYLKLHVRNTH